MFYHIYKEHEPHFPEGVDYLEEGILHECPFCEQIFLTDDDFRTHLADHESVMIWECALCNENFGTRIELEEHHTNLHNSFENSSYLARNMGDFSQVSSTINEQEIPILESTAKSVDQENFAHDDVEIVEEDTMKVVETSSRKRKHFDEILSVKFIGKLSKENMISNIISKKRRKCNKW